MKLLDFHCDTPAGLFGKKASLLQNDLHVDLSKTAPFEGYCQAAAFFCSTKYDNETGYDVMHQYATYLADQIASERNAALVTDAATLKAAFDSGKRAFLPAIEDLRILNGHLSRVRELRRWGVRLATLVWRDMTCIGGAWNTNEGLTSFGHEVLLALLDEGIVPDVSHASRKTLRETAECCRKSGKPFIATHSCAFALCGHNRNLTDDEIKLIASSGGVIGVNLYPPFLCESGVATLDDVIAHIKYLLSAAGTHSVVLGTDLDGVDHLPEGLSHVGDLIKIADAMSRHGFTDDEIDRLFYLNGMHFLQNNIV